MQVKQYSNPCKVKNFIYRLKNLSHSQAIEIKAGTIKPPELKPEKIRPVSKRSKVEFKDLQYANLQKRITKRLASKGVKIIAIEPTQPLQKAKHGIMDNIGKMIDTSYVYPGKPIRYHNQD